MKTLSQTIQAPFAALGSMVLSVVRELGAIFLFFFQSLGLIFAWPFQFKKIVEQIHFIGAKSMLVVILTSAFTGMVIGLQGYYTLSEVGSEGYLGSLVANSLIRELGPVFAAIMITARAGSAMAAEIGVMRISEQIDALQTMMVNPIRYLVSPRLAASLISFPLLTAIFDVVGIAGGWITGSILLNMNPYLYFYRVESTISMAEVMGGFAKSLVFAVVVCTISCYMGFTTHKREDGFGARGVSNSTTSAVVTCCVLILITDYMMTSFLR